MSPAILSKEHIQAAIESGQLDISPFDPANLKEASYTFTLAVRLLRVKTGQTFNVGERPNYDELSIPEEGYPLQPGEFVLGYTQEILSLNGKYACMLSVRGSCAQIGLNALLSDSFAEPDTDGCLALAIHNAGQSAILLQVGMKIVKGVFLAVS